MGNRLTALALAFFFSSILVSAESENFRSIVIGSAGGDLPPTIVASAILAEAYEKAGYRAEFIVYPPNRMLASLKMGTIDAIVLAEASLEREIQGVVRVDPPVWIDEIAVFSKESRSIRSWDDLKGLRVGYLTAMIIIERGLPEGATRFPAQTIERLFRMLDADRTDVVVTSRSIAKLMIRELGLTNIRYSGETLATVRNYHFVSSRNEDVALRVSEALADMERSGRIAEITKVTLEKLFEESAR